MIDEDKISEFIDTSPQRSIFAYPWWLEAVAGNDYRYVTIQKSGEIHAVLPVIQGKKFFLTTLTMPPYTQCLGPLLPVQEGKYSTKLSNEHKLIEKLINKLPPNHYCHIKSHPNLTNWLPFYWNEFKQTTKYTYILHDIADTDSIWQGFQSNTRWDIRKADEIVNIRQSDDVENLIRLQKLTFRRQDKELPHNPQIIRNIYESAKSKGCGQIFYAIDNDNNYHSGLLLVWDDRTAYYLIGGSDPELRSSGAASLLIWEAIQFAASKVENFNFEGSMIRGIERHFRGFGAVQTPYFSISKFSPSFLGKFFY